MEYEKLSKVFYKYGKEKHEEEYRKRTDGYGTYLTDLTIKPFRKGQVMNQDQPLFFVNIPQLSKLYEKVLLNSGKIQRAVSKLPTFAVEPYFQKLIVNEAQSNNEIEGVRSTKEELSNVLEHIEEARTEPKKRFVGMMKMYKYIDQLEPFTKVEDFRRLYDDFVADEIPKQKQPDGQYFRKEGVNVTDGTRITHRGIEPETKIIEKLTGIIRLLDDTTILDLYKYFIAHYYYEYIHPFYDGNGRTGRLLVCSYVSKKLERYSAITLSYSINNDKQKYYKALEEIADPLNKGDITFYLKDMLELLIAGQEALLDDLQVVIAKSQRIEQYIQQITWTNADEQKFILKILLDIAALSNHSRPLSNIEIKKITNLSDHKINKAMQLYEEKDIVTLIKQRPKTYELNDSFMDHIFGL